MKLLRKFYERYSNTIEILIVLSSVLNMQTNPQEFSKVLSHAASLIKQNADELWLAFADGELGIPPEDWDVENQICDLDITANLLLELAMTD